MLSLMKETQESLIALENYTRRENLRFMNIPECVGENCQDIIYDIMENDLKINTDEIRFHAVHRIGKPPGNDTTPTRPRPIIARFVVREDRDAVFSVKNRLKSSIKYKEAYITQDFARAIQKERKTLIQAMFAAKLAGRVAKVINRKLFIMLNFVCFLCVFNSLQVCNFSCSNQPAFFILLRSSINLPAISLNCYSSQFALSLVNFARRNMCLFFAPPGLFFSKLTLTQSPHTK